MDELLSVIEELKVSYQLKEMFEKNMQLIYKFGFLKWYINVDLVICLVNKL